MFILPINKGLFIDWDFNTGTGILPKFQLIRGDDTKFAFRSHDKFDYKRLFIWSLTRDSMKCDSTIN
jgi:hypothetical protein